MKGQDLDIRDFDYNLPEDRIAKYSLQQRDASKLLLYHKGHISHTIFRNFIHRISPDDLMIFNDTRVIQARFLFKKHTGAGIEIFCLEPKEPPEYESSFQEKSSVIWNSLIGNVKKWKNEPLYKTITHHNKEILLKAEKLKGINATWLVRLSWEPGAYSFGDILKMAGSTPIPPYLKREPVPEDKFAYQTVYSRIEGSVAAPTAGFHFTNEILNEIRKRGIGTMGLTLHVGAGTFRPVLSTEVSQHSMHSEHMYFKKNDLQKLLDFQGHILSVGTTSTRALETIYWLGCKVMQDANILPGQICLKQWEHHALISIPIRKCLEVFINYFEKNNINELHTCTQLMITPGYQYRIVDKMLTNFHQPRSTLLLLVSAFIGDDWKKVYKYAMGNEFRFLSYGDSSLLIP